MTEVIGELLVGTRAIGKLGKRGIAEQEVAQLLGNLHATARNPGSLGRRHRCLLIGRSNGRRYITLVIEETIDPTTWIVVTGWNSSRSERRMIANG